MTAFSWSIVAFLVILIFFNPVRALLAKVTDSIGSSAVAIDVLSTGFKLTVAEPTVTAPDDRRPLWSPSPFEVDDHAPGDAKSLLREVAPQLEVPASDYVAQYVLLKKNDPKVPAMREARTKLVEAAAKPNRDFASLRGELDAFVAALDACLYLEADQFADLLKKRVVLQAGIEALAPTNIKDADDIKNFMVLHAAGIGYSLNGDWALAAKTLDKIAWADTNPLYTPAGSMWLASKYHAYIQELKNDHPEVELDSTQFFAKVQELMERARKLLVALRAVAWDQARPSPHGYFIRELLKDIGSVGAILAEYSTPGQVQNNLLQRAEADLGECVAPIKGDNDTPLDHNNLADLYRQMGDAARRNPKPVAGQPDYYAKAHEQLDHACKLDPLDPAFCHTRALLFFSQRRFDDALRALEQCTEAQAEKEPLRDVDIEQYVDNQILAAKLLFALAPKSPDLTRITSVLEGAKRVANRHRATLGDKTTDDLLAKVEELLGDAYLQWPRREKDAVDAFDRLVDLKHGPPMDVVKVRRHLLHSRALIRLSRVRRREYSGDQAGRLRERARDILDALGTLLGSFKADSSVLEDVRRERNARFRLDAIVNLQSLAEEYFAGEDMTLAKSVLEQEAALLASLDKKTLPDRKMGFQIDRTAKRLAFLSGRILIELEPHTADLIGTVEKKFNEARGVSAEQNCQIDLELGGLLLRSARLGLGTPMQLYERAVASFERAAERNAPALRADTIRALATAYAMRDTIARLAKAKTGGTSQAAK